MSSAWIAHSLLDSIVDSFFPFSDEIEKEVMAIEQLVYSGDKGLESDIVKSSPALSPQSEKERLPSLSEKNVLELGTTFTARTRFALSRPPLHLLYRRILRYIRGRFRSSIPTEKSPPSSTTITLRRMATTRRLVTSLTRLLATKSEVVTQIRKRLLSGSGNGKASSSEEVEVAMYMGDVQDHILTLQNSLDHYERMLSQSHPTYLQQLRTEVGKTKSGADKALVYLSVVSMAVVCIQTIIGIFSLNVTLPVSTNFEVFGIVIAINCVVLTAFLGLVRRWWINAKRRGANVLG
jgi:magnesium transporter